MSFSFYDLCLDVIFGTQFLADKHACVNDKDNAKVIESRTNATERARHG